MGTAIRKFQNRILSHGWRSWVVFVASERDRTLNVKLVKKCVARFRSRLLSAGMRAWVVFYHTSHDHDREQEHRATPTPPGTASSDGGRSEDRRLGDCAGRRCGCASASVPGCA